MMRFDDVTVNVWKNRRWTANRQEPEDQKLEKQRAEIELLHHSYFHVAKIAHGTSAARTQGTGQRITPTPMNASAPKIHGRHCRGSTAASLITLATNSPAATLDTAPSALCQHRHLL